ncbi:MAG: penicillin-binding protein 2 [Candidatus Paceibacterota bacterium]|jgi:cell division protein FtsI/penicillin-binding protein 2|nr:penicillin-binding protein 2 [Candidatus Paceibacterota bacterium]MDD4875351.1 penicillin-binding protein 2 [Candidatus Paceibacterota bacterium]
MAFKSWRFNLVFFLLILFGSGILARLIDLQIVKGSFYKALAQGQQSVLSQTAPKRGDIYFKNGETLAATKEEPFLRVCVQDIENIEETAAAISQIIGEEKEEVFNTISGAEGFYKTIKENLSKEEIEAIESLEIKGVEIAWQNKRLYPNLNTGSQIAGFLNKDGEGQYGLEEYFNSSLTGQEKFENKKVNPWGFLFSGSGDSSSQENGLYLTVDYNIQFEAEKILKEGVEKYGAKAGEIIAAEPTTGKIIAMAQYPNFDPNKYGEEEMENFSNKSVQTTFEPGSIFKPITIAVALNEGRITPETVFHDSLGYRQIGGYKVYNFSQKIWGERKMYESLQYSINVGVMDAEDLVGNNIFYDYFANKFKFNEKTGVELAGEISSQNRELKKSLDNNIQVSFATASFGQGVEMTPLQIVRAFCGLANGGQMPEKMTIIEKKVAGGKEEQNDGQKFRQVISKKTSEELAKMMVNVVENGYGHLARIPGYYIAGKTGTAQMSYASLGQDKAGYSTTDTWQSFMGFAPAYSPRFVILVKLDNPANTLTSEYSAVPMFHDLARYILNYWQIAPDYDPDLATTSQKIY